MSISSFRYSVSPTTATPTLVWHISASSNTPAYNTTTGQNFIIPAVNTSLAGNTNILFLSYPSGNTPSITDTNGNTWPSASKTVDSGAVIAAVFVLKNIKPGLNTLTVSFAAGISPFSYRFSEWNNLDNNNPVDVTSGTAAVIAPSLSCGLLTPTQNNDLILSYFACSSTSGAGNPSSWSSGGSFTLLDADIAFTGGQGFPQASQYFISPNTSSINPSISANTDTQHYNCIAIALKSAVAGSPKPLGIYVNKIHHQSWPNVSPPATFKLQFPTVGNHRCIATNDQQVINISSITDSEGNNDWTSITLADATVPQIWYSANANKSANPNLTVTIHNNGTAAKGSIRFYDISGAAASPFDVSAGTINVDRGGTTTATGPTIQPTTSNGLVIYSLGLGNGPGLAITSPTNAIWDLCTYPPLEVDDELMENADGNAHFYNPDTSSTTAQWNITNRASPNFAATSAIAFKKA